MGEVRAKLQAELEEAKGLFGAAVSETEDLREARSNVRARERNAASALALGQNELARLRQEEATLEDAPLESDGEPETARQRLEFLRVRMGKMQDRIAAIRAERGDVVAGLRESRSKKDSILADLAEQRSRKRALLVEQQEAAAAVQGAENRWRQRTRDGEERSSRKRRAEEELARAGGGRTSARISH